MGNIRSWLEGVSSSLDDRIPGGDRSHRESRDYTDGDVDRVMRQISLAVSRSRGVSSLSRAVAKEKHLISEVCKISERYQLSLI